ncbi:MAG: response regulator transcription factor [Candidatus Aureabacteria bacterium]|nr:response regulator transcription factor [Candidatus Auribacterota bacterium]
MEDSSLKIAVVEDDNSLRELLKIRLGTQGFDVCDFANAEDAEEALLKNPVDVILLDANLPKKLGVELAKEIKQDPAFGNPKIIIITGVSFSVENIKRQWKNKYLIDDYIEKPFDFNILLQKIKGEPEEAD